MARQVDKGVMSVPVLCRCGVIVILALCGSEDGGTVAIKQCSGHFGNVCVWLSLCVHLGPCVKRSLRAEEVSEVGPCMGVHLSVDD